MGKGAQVSNTKRNELSVLISVATCITVACPFVRLAFADEDEVKPYVERGYTTEEVDPDFLEWSILEGKAAKDELTPDEEQKRRMLGSRVMDRMLGMFMARYILQGEVVDQDGNRLDDVHVRVNKARARGPDHWAEERVDQKVNGTFSLDFDVYTALYLYFNKEGYYQEMLSFGFEGGSATGEDIILRDRPLRKNIVEKRDIRVVMEKKGDITSLIAYDSAISWTTHLQG